LEIAGEPALDVLSLAGEALDGQPLIFVAQHLSKDMDHATYMGGTGTNVLGSFRVQTSGIGDTSVSALVRIRESVNSRLHASMGLSLPTGKTDALATVLTPMNSLAALRAPYPMQLGSGTYDLLPGLTYTNFLSDQASAGLQWRGVIRTGDNDEGYTLGDEHRLTGWYARQITNRLSWSARVEYFERANVDGFDPMIRAPVQTADPERQGASRIDVGLGLNVALSGGHRFSLEDLSPVDQNLDGPQLEVDDQLMLGYQLSF
jgi:hypothetical protein